MLAEPQKQAIEHICYEMKRMKECYERWLQIRLRGGSQIEVNDLIELILLHTRAVLDFFECSRVDAKITAGTKKAFPDDIISEDYGWSSSEIPIDRMIKARINKEIAHLSYARCGLTKKQKEWPFDTFVPELLEHCEKFLEHLSKC